MSDHHLHNHSSDNHEHHHHHSHPKSNSSLRFRIIQIVISLLILLITPWFITFLTDNTIDSVKDKYRQTYAYESESIYSGEVINLKTETSMFFEQEAVNQVLTVQSDSVDGDVTINNTNFADPIRVVQGDRIFFIGRLNEQTNEIEYNFIDVYRLDTVVWLLAIFVILVIILAGLKGINGFIGLAFTTIIIFSYLLPEILAGNNIFFATLISAFFITGFSFYLSHGFNKPTSIAVFATFITITITVIGSIVVENLMKFSGVSSHELSHLQSFQTLNNAGLDLRSLFVASIILGTLGVLDDVTISQAFIVDELYKANPKSTFIELFLAAIRIGKEHIISLINTLTLAYFATGMPFVIQYIVFGYDDIFVTLNSEVISGEIVRTIIGSMSLFLAIPITTLLSAYLVKKDVNFANLKKLFRQS